LEPEKAPETAPSSVEAFGGEEEGGDRLLEGRLREGNQPSPSGPRGGGRGRSNRLKETVCGHWTPVIVRRHRYKYSREGNKTRDDVRQQTAIAYIVNHIVPNKSQSGETGWV